MASRLSEVKYLLFDVLGTVVDTKGGLLRSLTTVADRALNDKSRSIPQDAREKASKMGEEQWRDLSKEWNARYLNYAKNFPNGTYDGKVLDASEKDKAPTEYVPLDTLNPLLLRKTVEDWGLEGLWGAEDIAEICNAWHRLPAWPDSVEGLHMLKSKYPIVTLSDGNERLLRDMADNAQLPWSKIFGGDTCQAYKPNPHVYKSAAERLGAKPSECALVAAHLPDLKAAVECGLHSVYIERPGEERMPADEMRELKESNAVDVWIDHDSNSQGLISVAKALGCTERAS